MPTASKICLCRSVIATSSGGAASHDVSSSNLVMLHRPRPLVSTPAASLPYRLYGIYRRTPLRTGVQLSEGRTPKCPTKEINHG
jgi:hypothetical protein